MLICIHLSGLIWYDTGNDLLDYSWRENSSSVEGQVLDDSKNTIITKEEDEFVNFISYLTISIHDSLVEVNQALIAWSFR